jgi:beta-glucanase (GH16 family)
VIRPRWSLLVVATLALTLAGPADAAPTHVVPPDAAGPRVAGASVVEHWRGYSGPFHKTHDANRIVVVPNRGAKDGKALKLQLDARPGPGPRQGVEIASNTLDYRYGTFGTRMKTANCTGQDHVGVVTGLTTYSPDQTDTNADGRADNHEIDIEFLCGQPEVIWMSLWTDYDERTDTPGKISRAIDLRTGQVIYNCYLLTWLGACEPLLAGENQPTAVRAVPRFNSATQFHSYSFDWQPDRVRFYLTIAKGKKITLWDYRGPSSRIPQKPSLFLQNVWYTPVWDPFNGPSHRRPTAAAAAYLDSTTVPKRVSTR